MTLKYRSYIFLKILKLLFFLNTGVSELIYLSDLRFFAKVASFTVNLTVYPIFSPKIALEPMV